MPAARSPRKPTSQLSQTLQNHVNMYALAAGAAGVGMLALARPAQAKIVYTPANQQIPLCDALDLDLNHDGVTDFVFYHCSTGQHGGVEVLTSSTRAQLNVVWGANRLAAALKRGFEIRPSKEHFQPGHGGMAFWNCTNYGQTCTTDGKWSNVNHRFLGLKFMINGKTHYGWARLNVVNKGGITATLTGYAYETVPNQPIVAGQKRGAADSGSLGALAGGSTAAQGK